MAGGHVRKLYLVWKATGGRTCPYRLHHVLDEDYRPLDRGPRFDRRNVRARPPVDHRRVRNIVIGFARAAENEQIALAQAAIGG